MPFNPTGSVVSTDLDNMLRGLYRDNSDHAVTGTVVETPLAGLNISPNTIGPTGGLFVLAVGTCAGATSTKSIRLYFGGVLLASVPVPVGSQCWFIKVWIYNTATNAQRIYIETGSIPALTGTQAAPVLSYAYAIASIDTSQNQVLQTRTVNASALDTATNTMFDVYVAQIN